MHGQQARHALDHHLAHLVLGLADQRDAARAFTPDFRRGGDVAHPFGAGARLAGTAPADEKPGDPGLAVVADRGRELMRMTVENETADQLR